MHRPMWMTVEQYVEALEAFMVAVARELKCLPSFADPTPEDGNAHILRKLRELVAWKEFQACLAAREEAKKSDPTESMPPWPCQQLHGGRAPYTYQGCDPTTGRCNHPECNPANRE